MSGFTPSSGTFKVPQEQEMPMEPDFDEADAEDEDDDAPLCSFLVIQLAPRLPFEFSFRLPFSRNRVRIGQDSMGRLRRQTRLHPQDIRAHTTLAARLLSESPVLPVHAEEAAEQLSLALSLMPPDAEIGDEAQRKAMVHQFLGDALIVLGKRTEARSHWERAVALDPVAPPYGFAGRAQEMLNTYPPV